MRIEGRDLASAILAILAIFAFFLLIWCSQACTGPTQTAIAAPEWHLSAQQQASSEAVRIDVRGAVDIPPILDAQLNGHVEIADELDWRVSCKLLVLDALATVEAELGCAGDLCVACVGFGQARWCSPVTEIETTQIEAE